MILFIPHSSNKQNVYVRGCCISGISVMSWGHKALWGPSLEQGLFQVRKAVWAQEPRQAPGANPFWWGRVLCCRAPWGRSYPAPVLPTLGPRVSSQSFLPFLGCCSPTIPFWPLLISLQLRRGNGNVLRRGAWKNQECFLKPWLVWHPSAQSTHWRVVSSKLKAVINSAAGSSISIFILHNWLGWKGRFPLLRELLACMLGQNCNRPWVFFIFPELPRQ